MIKNSSPWLAELARTRPVAPLDSDATSDVVIVGGGIAGAATAFFTLRDTDKSVVLLEADRVAHGATGHNAGQVVAYFERPLASIAEEFGVELAGQGQRMLESSWGLIDRIIAEASLKTPLYRFTGYTGYTELETLIGHLEDNRIRVTAGLVPYPVLVNKESGWGEQIPLEYRDLWDPAPHTSVLSLLETDDRSFNASLAEPKGCMNSARFTEELIGFLIATYPGRFSLYEESKVDRIILREDSASLVVGDQSVEAGRVVLCTNGFERFHIENGSGSDIDTEFHHLMHGVIGYMSGYLEPLDAAPTAQSYYPKGGTLTAANPEADVYFYFTRRPHDAGKGAQNLVCAGGPEQFLPELALYSRTGHCREDFHDALDGFLSSTYKSFPEHDTEYVFCWHGLMGYTTSRIRRIGIEPCNPVLLYNLGCNGVGILPSLLGGERIARILAGESLERSIFDPADQRCML